MSKVMLDVDSGMNTHLKSTGSEMELILYFHVKLWHEFTDCLQSSSQFLGDWWCMFEETFLFFFDKSEVWLLIIVKVFGEYHYNAPIFFFRNILLCQFPHLNKCNLSTCIFLQTTVHWSLLKFCIPWTECWNLFKML